MSEITNQETVEERAAKLVEALKAPDLSGPAAVTLVVKDYHVVFKLAQQMTLVAVDHVIEVQEQESSKMSIRGLDPGWRRPLRRLRETLRSLRPVKA